MLFGERGERANLCRVGEEAGEEMEALDEPGQQIDVRLAFLQVGDSALKPRPQRVDGILDLRIRPCGGQLREIGGILLGEYPGCQNFGVSFQTKLLVRFVRCERRAFAVFLERLEDGGGVVGEIHDHDILLSLVTAIQPRDRLHRVTIHHRFVEEHACEKG